jgi:hypothetical protein
LNLALRERIATVISTFDLDDTPKYLMH